jgi:hypothetical protein
MAMAQDPAGFPIGVPSENLKEGAYLQLDQIRRYGVS